MKSELRYYKYFLIFALVIAIFAAVPVQAAETAKENTEEVEETKLFCKENQSVKQKPKHNADRNGLTKRLLIAKIDDQYLVRSQLPKYILYCNLIFYE
ncbi:MAG: hypothetical protein AAF616_03140 [Bacteroidota bacterium]